MHDGGTFALTVEKNYVCLSACYYIIYSAYCTTNEFWHIFVNTFGLQLLKKNPQN